jgi:hypothetical protein
MIRPPEAGPLLAALAPLFTHPTFDRFVTLTAAGLPNQGRRTVANLLRTVGALAGGHRTSYQRVLSAARWSGVELSCALAALLLRHLIPAGPVTLVGDDTVDGHKGRRCKARCGRRGIASTKVHQLSLESGEGGIL